MSIGVTLKEIDLALAVRYTGMTIGVGDPAVSTPVAVFIEKPNSEEFPERKFPSIVVQNLGMFPDFPRQHTTDDDDIEEAGDLDTGPSPPERAMTQAPTPYRIQYSVDTWHKVRISEDRDLVTEAFLARTRPRGFLPQVGANEVDLNAFWVGSLAVLDEVETDEVIFHKSLSLEVLADLIPSTAVVNRKVVTDLIWRTDITGLLYSTKGEPSIDVDDLTTDARFKILVNPDGVEVL